MRVSVVVPIYNAEKTLTSCLESVTAQSVAADEILLVDNGSGDRSVEVVGDYLGKRRHPSIRLLHEPLRGPSAARNRGAEDACGEILAFTDADCVAERDWIEEIKKAFSDPNLDGVAGRISGHSPQNSIQRFLSLFTLRTGTQDRVHTRFTLLGGGFPTANLAFRQQIFRKVGGFDLQREMYSEDFDLCARVYQCGGRIRYTSSVGVRHIHRSGLRGLLRQSYGFGWGHACLLAVHFRRMVILELPGKTIQTQKLPLRIWANLLSADKKAVFLAALSVLYWPLGGLLAAYLIYLYSSVKGRLQEAGYATGWRERWTLVALLLLKSSAMTLGKVAGALRFRVICF